MTYGHRTGWLADPVAERFVPLPDDLDPLLGVYVAHMGPICANGLLHAAADLHGTDVRAPRRRGTRPAGRRGRRRGGGAADGAVRPAPRRRLGGGARPHPAPPPGRRGARSGNPRPGRGRPGGGAQDPLGATAPATGAPTWCSSAGAQAWALHLALRLLRPQGTVIDLAFYQDGADAVRLGEEFHHNGLSLRCAQIGRVPRGLAPHLGPRAALRRDHRPAPDVRRRDPQAPRLGGGAVRRGARPAHRPGRPSPPGASGGAGHLTRGPDSPGVPGRGYRSRHEHRRRHRPVRRHLDGPAGRRRRWGRPVGLAALLPYLREHRGTLVVVGALSLVGAAASLAQPLLTRSVLDRIGAERSRRRPGGGAGGARGARRGASAGCATTCCNAPPKGWCWAPGDGSPVTCCGCPSPSTTAAAPATCSPGSARTPPCCARSSPPGCSRRSPAR